MRISDWSSDVCSSDLLGPNILANVEQGLAMSVAQVARAQAAHSALYRRFLAFMADYDLLICPTVSVPPFPHSQLSVDVIDAQPARTYFHWLALPYGLTLPAHPVKMGRASWRERVWKYV